MKISKETWHYKLNASMSSHNETMNKRSLCTYFWFTVLSCMKVALIILLVFTSIIMLASPYFALFIDSFETNLPIPLIGLVFNYFVFGMICYELIKMQYSQYKEKYGWGEGANHQKQNIALDYVKAKKQKICPTIEFE